MLMIYTFTDFGNDGPYMGQMRAVLHAGAPGIPVVDLMTDAPAFNPQASSYLLPAVTEPLPEGGVFLAVVDPGVGSSRAPVILRANERWYVGPDNGLLEMVARQSESKVEWWEITHVPDRFSATFHGRDLFAPVAAKLAIGGRAAIDSIAIPVHPDRTPFREWADDLAEVIYIDGYGNCMLGLRWSSLSDDFEIAGPTGRITLARTFSDVPKGETLCYENAMGLAEIAVNGDNAARKLGLEIGSKTSVRKLSG
jgi:hypothetical protein